MPKSDRAIGLEQLRNMKNHVATWPLEERQAFYSMADSLEKLAKESSLGKCAVMYVGMKLACDQGKKG